MLHPVKIRIRTYVLGINHGQLLQAKGMCDILQETYPQASVKLDLYHNHILKEVYSQFKKLSLIKSIALLLNWFHHCKFSLPRFQRDLTAFGADTIWMHNHPVAPNDEYFFGSDIQDGVLAAICPSNAGSPYPASKNIQMLLRRFRLIGVRDNHTSNFVNNTINKEVPVVCDPAFFIDTSKLKTATLRQQQKITVYANSCGSIQRELNSDSTEKRDPQINYVFLGYFPHPLQNISKQFLGIYGVLNEISQSKLLITDTFHGVIMALITRTPFLLLKSDIVLSRLNGPTMQLFGAFRICDIQDLNLKLQNPKIYAHDDLDYNELESFVDFSKKHIISELKNITE